MIKHCCMCGRDKSWIKSISFVDGDTFYICESHCMIEILNGIIAGAEIHGNVVESNGFECTKTKCIYKGLWSKK